jgi:hypothetical protein
MSNPWLSVPLDDYEGHMSSAGVDQLRPLAELFKCALEHCRPASVAVLGVAGGNGLEQIDTAVTRRIVGLDINQHYLDQVERRLAGKLRGLELHCRNLAEPSLGIPPVDLVHAALIFEHAGVGAAVDNALSLVNGTGKLSVVLQLPSTVAQGVAATSYATMQTLKKDFTLIDPRAFQDQLAAKGFLLLAQQSKSIQAGKGLWLGIFERES